MYNPNRCQHCGRFVDGSSLQDRLRDLFAFVPTDESYRLPSFLCTMPYCSCPKSRRIVVDTIRMLHRRELKGDGVFPVDETSWTLRA